MLFFFLAQRGPSYLKLQNRGFSLTSPILSWFCSSKMTHSNPVIHNLRSAATFLVLYLLVVLVSGTTTPVAVVLSGSMEPNLHIGDIILQRGSLLSPITYKVGDIITFQLTNCSLEHPIPIVHRITKTYPDSASFMTRGDANAVDDRWIWSSCAKRQYLHHRALDRSEILGLTYFRLPYLGLPLVWLTHLFGPSWKWVLAIVLAIFEFYPYLEKNFRVL